MSFELVPGQRTWSASRDDDGHRIYKIKFLVRGDVADGPALALQCSGLPGVGDIWDFDNDLDIWATCRQQVSVTPHAASEGEPWVFFVLEFTFSTVPDSKRCKDQQIEDPLLTPPTLTGSSNKYQEQAEFDRFGQPIMNSAHELIRGPKNEWDANRSTVVIEQNVPLLQLALCEAMRDTVNAFPLWGAPPRTIKLSDFKWERKFYGLCTVYYTRTFHFEIRLAESFDRTFLDEGTKVLNGHWGGQGKQNWVKDNLGPITAPSGLTALKLLGGSLTSGTYQYEVTALDGNGGESTASAPLSVVLTSQNVIDDFQSIELSWTAVTGATGYNVYVKGGVATSFELLDAGAGITGTTFTDNGTSATELISPPSSNSTGIVPDSADPRHFIRFKDRNGENTKVLLDGQGQPAGTNLGSGSDTVSGGPPGTIFVQKYDESDFLLLGLPTDF